MSNPRKGTRAYVVREVAIREGWTERKAAAILSDGFANGNTEVLKHRKETGRELADLHHGEKMQGEH